MQSIQERLDKAVDTTEKDSNIFHEVVHGDENSSVMTEGGEVPTVAKAVKGLITSITNESNDIVKIAKTSAEIAKEKAIICQNSEQIITEKVKIADHARIWAEGSDEEVAQCGGTRSARGWVELARKTTIGSYPTTITGVATEKQQDLSLKGVTLGVKNQILSVVIENTMILQQNYNLSSDGKFVHLLNPLIQGENWSITYLQDIQTLSTLVGAITYEDMRGE